MYEKAKYVGHIFSMGRTRDEVLCPCGAETTFYRWSMAGHGKGRCSGCGRWIQYGTLILLTEDGKLPHNPHFDD